VSIGLQIEIRSADVDLALQGFFDGIRDRAELHQQVGTRARDLTRSHLVAIAQTRHATAERLGATPSGYWAQAAEKTTFAADAEAATVSIKQKGIGRVAHDITITPGAGKKYLTIPAIAEAYNQRAYRVAGLHAMVRWINGERRAIAMSMTQGTGKARTETVWYWLVRSVTQLQDRTLLPSDEEYRLAALAGISDYIDSLLAA
jgi:hypothetical protein